MTSTVDAVDLKITAPHEARGTRHEARGPRHEARGTRHEARGTMYDIRLLCELLGRGVPLGH